MKQVIACIADSPQAATVCDYAIWAARRLDTDLELLHVLEREPDVVPIADLSGGVWMGAQDTLLNELAELDKQRDALAEAHGKQLVDVAVARARAQGAQRVDGSQRRGALVDILLEIEPDTRLFVLGRHADGRPPSRLLPDPHLEASVRALRRPVLIAQGNYRAPSLFLIAFDGSPTARHTVDMVCRSPLLTGLPCDLVTVGKGEGLDEAAAALSQAGFAPRTAVLPGEVVPALTAYAREQQVDLLIMGAYGHSRIRQWVLGSTTTALLHHAPAPVLILR